MTEAIVMYCVVGALAGFICAGYDDTRPSGRVHPSRVAACGLLWPFVLVVLAAVGVASFLPKRKTNDELLAETTRLLKETERMLETSKRTGAPS